MRRGEYGYYAPYALMIFASLALLSGIAAALAWWSRPPAAPAFTLFFVAFLGNTVSFFYTTKRGKFLEWERILDRMQLRGDETVLRYGLRPRRGTDGGRAQADHGAGDGRRYLEQEGPVR